MQNNLKFSLGDHRSLLALLIASCAILRVWLALNLPLRFLPQAGADDGLFMHHAVSLLAGNWLGSYSQMTLVKGPGYPWFLAFASWTGLPISAAHVLFQLAAIGTLSWATLRLTGSRILASAIFIVLTLHPVGYSNELQRVIRDQIYWAQSILLLGLLVIAFLAPFRSRILTIIVSVGAGLCFGWTWLTREEGVWLLPAIAVLLIGGVWFGQRRKVLGSLLIIALSFLVVLGSFRTLNYIAYGSFVGVEVKESGFVRAMDALQSVQIGKRPYLPVSVEARSAVAEISPTFSVLEKALEPGEPLARWGDPACRLYSSTCGDIGGGWFMWALRAASQQAGYFDTPQSASKAFNRIADDIESACDLGTLPCRDSIISLMPTLSWQQVLAIPQSAQNVIAKIVYWNIANPAPGHRKALNGGSHAYSMWSFLNFPRITDGPSSSGEAIAGLARRGFDTIYGVLMPGLAIIGIVAWFASLIAWRKRDSKIYLLVAFAIWTLVATRVAVLVLIDVSSFPAANLLYGAPACFLLPIASLLSLASARQAFGAMVATKWSRRSNMALNGNG